MGIDISLDIYKIFCTVVKFGSMSTAAKELYISQPAVSMAIKQMESKLGRPLLNRTARGIKTTAEGAVLFEHLNKALGLVEFAEKKYMELLNLESGEIRLGGGETIFRRILLPYIEKFVTAYPNINIKVTNRTTGGTLNLLKSGAIDIGFVNTPLECDDCFEVYECYKVHNCLIGGSRYKHLQEIGLEVMQLKDYPLVTLENASNSRQYINHYAEEHGLNLQPTIELGNLDLLIDFVGINMGLGFTIKEFVAEQLAVGRIFEIPIRPNIPAHCIAAVRLKNTVLPNATYKFLDMISTDSLDKKPFEA